MPDLCFITCCMGRLWALRQTLGRMIGQPGCSCVVVDYACPDRAGDWVEKNFPEARVVRRPGRSEFSRSDALNVGASFADAPWLCFIDADILLEPGFSAAFLPTIEEGCYYRDGSWAIGTGGTFACSRATFERVGGYDEVYRGWGEEDNDLYHALEFIGIKQKFFPDGMMHHLEHGDEQRALFQSVDMDTSGEVNIIYRKLKWRAARTRGELLPFEARSALYDKVFRLVTDQTGESLEIPDSRRGPTSPL